MESSTTPTSAIGSIQSPHAQDTSDLEAGSGAVEIRAHVLVEDVQQQQQQRDCSSSPDNGVTISTAAAPANVSLEQTKNSIHGGAMDTSNSSSLESGPNDLEQTPPIVLQFSLVGAAAAAAASRDTTSSKSNSEGIKLIPSPMINMARQEMPHHQRQQHQNRSPDPFSSPQTAPPRLTIPKASVRSPPLTSPSPPMRTANTAQNIQQSRASPVSNSSSTVSWSPSPNNNEEAFASPPPILFTPSLSLPPSKDRNSNTSPSSSPLLRRPSSDDEDDGGDDVAALFKDTLYPDHTRTGSPLKFVRYRSQRHASRMYSRSSSMVATPETFVLARSPVTASPYAFRRQRSLPVQLERATSQRPSSRQQKPMPTRSDIFRPRSTSMGSNKSLPQNLTGITESDDEENVIRGRQLNENTVDSYNIDDEEDSIVLSGNVSDEELHRRPSSRSSHDLESPATFNKKRTGGAANTTTNPTANSNLSIFMNIIYLSACSVLGTSTRLAVGRWMLNVGVTSTSGPFFQDLPANALGSAIMGAVVAVDLNAAVVGVGLCGSITTLSAWNTQLVRMMVNGQVLPAMAGYLIGFQTALSSYTGGRQLTFWLHQFLERHTNIRPMMRIGNFATSMTAIALLVIYGIVGFLYGDAWFRELFLSCLWSPFGVLLRWQLSQHLNERISLPFPTGTWASNMIGSILSAVAAARGWTAVGNGLAGSLSTVSSLVKEVHALTPNFAWGYGALTILSCSFLGTISYVMAGGV